MDNQIDELRQALKEQSDANKALRKSLEDYIKFLEGMINDYKSICDDYNKALRDSVKEIR